jgi:hypothetical protein
MKEATVHRASRAANSARAQEVLSLAPMRFPARIAAQLSLAVGFLVSATPAFPQGIIEAAPQPSTASGRWSPPSSLVLPEANATAPVVPLPPAPKTSNELTLPSLGNQQASVPQAPKSDSTKVIPVIPPNQEVLVLPQASRDFLGFWGGQLTLLNKYGGTDPPEHQMVSFTFGEREGQVVLATTVYGNANAQVLNTTAEAEGPNKVVLTLAGLDLSTQPPLRHIEKLTISLVGNNQVKCKKQMDLYMPGVSGPAAEALYEGILGPMTRREGRMISEEIIRNGEVPRATINEGNAPQLPPE